MKNLICWWKGHSRVDVFRDTEFTGTNVYCGRCLSPLEPEETWTERCLRLPMYLTHREEVRQQMNRIMDNREIMTVLKIINDKEKP